MSKRCRERHRLEEQLDFVDDRLLKQARRERNSKNYKKRCSGYYIKKGAVW